MSASAPTFTYRLRRGGHTLHNALPGAAVILMEQVEYLLEFEAPPSGVDRQRLIDLGGEFLRDDMVVLSFRNFVGRTSVVGVSVEVTSNKIGPGGVSRILEEISALSATLVFGWRSSTGFASMPDSTRASPVPYHQLQFLRHTMLSEPPGRRLQDWLHVIQRNPTRRFEPERSLTPVNRVRRLDQRAIQLIFSRLDRLVPLREGVQIAEGSLAQKLTLGVPPQAHFPMRVDTPRGRLSFDTPENRFIRHAISECLGIIHRFIDHPKLHDSLKSDCRLMLALLEPVASAPFVAEANRLVTFGGPTQALAKADGYREVFQFWNDLTQHVSLPREVVETTRILEGRDMATLYEYWTFVKILECTCNIVGHAPRGRPVIRRDEMGESLSLGITTTLNPGLEIGFNLLFRRASRTAYSTPLRPDVTLRTGAALHVFDAKYRLDRFDAEERDPDDDPATYKRADLYKMHTYRDAISHLRSAFVVYPGTEFVFFERHGDRRTRPEDIVNVDGVGALPLRPAERNPVSSLGKLLGVLLTTSQ